MFPQLDMYVTMLFDCNLHPVTPLTHRHDFLTVQALTGSTGVMPHIYTVRKVAQIVSGRRVVMTNTLIASRLHGYHGFLHGSGKLGRLVCFASRTLSWASKSIGP